MLGITISISTDPLTHRQCVIKQHLTLLYPKCVSCTCILSPAHPCSNPGEFTAPAPHGSSPRGLSTGERTSGVPLAPGFPSSKERTFWGQVEQEPDRDQIGERTLPGAAWGRACRLLRSPLPAPPGRAAAADSPAAPGWVSAGLPAAGPRDSAQEPKFPPVASTPVQRAGPGREPPSSRREPPQTAGGPPPPALGRPSAAPQFPRRYPHPPTHPPRSSAGILSRHACTSRPRSSPLAPGFSNSLRRGGQGSPPPPGYSNSRT